MFCNTNLHPMSDCYFVVYGKNRFNKKVLLRERKRHTARRVVTTPFVVLTGYPPPPAGYPLPPGWTWQGTPPPRLDLAGYPPPAGPGRVPPPRCLPHGILGNVANHYGIWVPPLWTDRRTDTCQNITFPSYYVRRR